MKTEKLKIGKQEDIPISKNLEKENTPTKNCRTTEWKNSRTREENDKIKRIRQRKSSRISSLICINFF